MGREGLDGVSVHVQSNLKSEYEYSRFSRKQCRLVKST